MKNFNPVYPKLFLYNRFFSKFYLIQKLHQIFWVFISKFNKNLKPFFSDIDSMKKENYISDLILVNEFHQNKLVDEGISVATDALPIEEHKKFFEICNGFESVLNEDITQAEFYNTFGTKIISSNKEYAPEQLSRMAGHFYSDQAINLSPTLYEWAKELFYFTFGMELPKNKFFIEIISEKSSAKENISKLSRDHIDRFIPATKILYSPKEINKEQSPFVFWKKSHKTNKEKLKWHDNFIRQEISHLKDETNYDQNIWKAQAEKSGFIEEEILCQPNQINLVMTSGLHRRSGFKYTGDYFRHMVFISFYNCIGPKEILKKAFIKK